MPKRKCSFNRDLKEEYPFLKETTANKVECTVCHSTFSIEHGGRADIKQHVVMKKHKQAVAASSSSSSLSSFFTHTEKGQLTDENKRLAAQEALFAFHTAKHNLSLRSMDCTSAIIKKLFEKRFTCGRTKCKSILVNVLAPFAMREIVTQLKDAKFISVMVDTSNHKDLKLVPVLVRYFIPNEGIQVKVLEFQNIVGETAELMGDHILDILRKFQLTDRIIAFSADNCNTNFGGYKRTSSNNVFSRVKVELEHNIYGIGCAAHVVHNASHISADILPVDIESIINKIFQYFHIYTVRVHELKHFCEFVQVEYERVLGCAKTRWLSLLPAVSRVIDMYDGLKSYFLSQNRCPTVLKAFFTNPQSTLWLHFIQSQLKVFSETILKIERENICATEVIEELESLKQKIINRRNANFQTANMTLIISELKEEGILNEKQFADITALFYDTFLEYLNKWTCHLEPLRKFQWIKLNVPLAWTEVASSLKVIRDMQKKMLTTIDEDVLFDEMNHINNVVCTKTEEWKVNKTEVETKWCDVFTVLKQKDINVSNILPLVQFVLAIPGTNAAVERIFSLTNSLWTDEKNRLSVDTVKSIIVIKTHFQNKSCLEFYDFISTNSKLLQEIISSVKYTM